MKSTTEKCDFCFSPLEYLYSPVNSKREARVFVCPECLLVQTKYSKKIAEKKRPSISCDADWGNIRIGKRNRLFSNLSFILKYCDFTKIKTLLDVGSNRGDFIKYISQRFSHLKITAIEPDSNLIDYKNEFEVIKRKFEKVELSEKYDFIYCSHTLEHVDSLRVFINKLKEVSKKDSILFIDVPNLIIIEKDRNIVEEFFMDKHTFHFTEEVLENIFLEMGFKVVAKEVDWYNIQFLLKPIEKKEKILHNYQKEKKLKEIKVFIKNYEMKLKENRKILEKLVTEKLSKFFKRQKVGFWGATRVFDAFVKYGKLSPKDVFILVDKYVWKVLPEVYGIPVREPEYLKIYTPHVIFVCARSSAKKIEKTTHEMGFRWVVTFDELMSQGRLLFKDKL